MQDGISSCKNDFEDVETLIMRSSARSLFGRRFSDPSVQSNMRHWPSRVIAGPGLKPMIVVNFKVVKKQFAVEEISSTLLTKMRETLRLTLI